MEIEDYLKLASKAGRSACLRRHIGAVIVKDVNVGPSEHAARPN